MKMIKIPPKSHQFQRVPPFTPLPLLFLLFFLKKKRERCKEGLEKRKNPIKMAKIPNRNFIYP